MENNTYETDVIIIGAGPVGLFAVFECGMLKMKCHVVEALDFVGGQCNALYPEKPIYDIPAHTKIAAQDLITNLRTQAASFNPVYHLSQRAEKVEENADGTLKVITSKGTVINTKAIIIAAGCGAFGPNRPPMANIEDYEGKSVFYMVKSREDFRDKNVVIAGGGDSAVDWALSLKDVAKKVSLVHRREKFRCAPDSAEKIKQLAEEGVIDLVVPYQLEGIKGQNGNMEAIIVKDLEDNTKEIAADAMLAFFGLTMQLGPIENWNLDINCNLINVDPVNMQTSIKGVFAVGDIITYPGKLKLILSGFNDAAVAAHGAYKIVFPEVPLNFEYSTHKGV